MLKEMKYVYTVYQEGSFSNAAEKLFLSQPVVSSMVKRAEEEFNAKIFDRTTRPVSLTAEGEIYIHAIESIQKIESEILSMYSTKKESIAETIVIGASTFFCTYLLPSLIRDFQEKNPDINVSFNLLECSNTEARKMLQGNKLDFVLEADEMGSNKLDSIVCGEGLLLLAAPNKEITDNTVKSMGYSYNEIVNREHLKNRRCVSLAAFKNSSFVMLKDGNDTTTRGLLLCKGAGFRPKKFFQVDHLLTVYNLIVEGNGVGFIPDYFPKHVGGSEDISFYLIDSPITRHSIKFYHSLERTLSDEKRVFWDYVCSKNILL